MESVFWTKAAGIAYDSESQSVISFVMFDSQQIRLIKPVDNFAWFWIGI